MAKQGLRTAFREAQERLDEIRRSGEFPFEDRSKEAARQRVETAKRDRMFFLRTYFPHYCTSESPAYHAQLFKLCDIRKKPVAVTAPRGGAKSVIASFAEPLHRIYFARMNFHIFISDTTELAADFCSFIRFEIEENERLLTDFGELRGKRSWAADDFVTKNGIRLLARGFKTRVRGIRHGAKRPNSFTIDDYENDEEQFNPRILSKKENYINNVVIPSLDPDGWSGIYVGTLLSTGCVLGRFMQSDKWIHANFPALSVDGVTPDISAASKSFWPARFPKDDLLETRDLIGERAFNQEYQGVVVDEDTAVFRRKWFRRVPLTRELVDSMKFRVAYVDASAKSGTSNDFKAIIVIGWNGSGYVVLYAWIRHATISEMLDRMYDVHTRFGISCWGMEEVAFQSLFRELLPMVGAQKGFQLPMQYRKGLPPKEVRISAIQPYYENGQIDHAETCGDFDAGDTRILEEQLIYFPNPNVNDDGPDGEEGAIDLAQKLGAGMAEFGEVTGGGRGRASFSYGNEKAALRNIA